MSFPDHKILPADKSSWLSAALEQKLLEFSPYTICEFYQGFDVLQLYGNESKEYIFGNYFNGKYCGYIYLGDKYSLEEVSKICEIYMPKNWKDVSEYHLKFSSEIWYNKLKPSQYAWIFNKVLQKIN